MTAGSHDLLCRLSRGWFCRRVWWRVQRTVEVAHLSSLAARIAVLDAEVHPERYAVPDPAAWERDHARGEAAA